MKKIKYLLVAFVIFICFLGSSVGVSAVTYSSGKAFIPSFYTSTNSAESYYVSNITDYPIEVIVTFYNNDGTIVTDDNNSGAGRIKAVLSTIENYSEVTPDTSLTFTLAAHKTVIFQLPNTTTTYFGYGTIEWKQNGTTIHGLIATKKQGTVAGYVTEELLNSGMPF